MKVTTAIGWHVLAVDENKKAAAIQRSADSQKRDLTADELAAIDRHMAVAEAYDKNFEDLDRKERHLGPDEPAGVAMLGKRLIMPSSNETMEAAARGEFDHLVRGASGRASGRSIVDADGRKLRVLGRDERVSAGVPGADDVDVGRFLQAVITGRHEALSGTELRAMSGGSDTGGGYLLPTALSAMVVDLARSASVCLRAGAGTVPMETAELSIARLTQDPVGQWRRETVAVTSSELDFDRVTLRPKTLAAVVPISIELFEDAPNAGQIIQSALSAALGLKLDQAALNGTGTAAEPRGVANEPGIGEVSSVGADFGADYIPITQAIGKVMTANFPGDPAALSLVAHPRDLESIDGFVDSTGQPLSPTPWSGAIRKFSTTSLPINLGGGSNESLAVLGDFSQLLFGMRTSGVTIRVLDQGSVTDSAGTTWNATSQLMRLVVAYLRADVCVLRPSWFTKLTGILA